MGGYPLDPNRTSPTYQPYRGPGVTATPPTGAPGGYPGYGGDTNTAGAPGYSSYNPGALPWEQQASGAAPTNGLPIYPPMSAAANQKLQSLYGDDRKAFEELGQVFNVDTPIFAQMLGSAVEGGKLDAYLKLSPEQQQQFLQVARTMGVDDPNDVHALPMMRNLLDLLGNGKLVDTDTGGRTTLAELAKLTTPGPIDSRFADQPDLEAGGQTNRATVLRELVGDLAHPEGIFQGTDSRTCGSAALQVMLASSNPAEYARIATSLALTGQAFLPPSKENVAGTVLELSDAGLKGGNDRSPLGNAMQASFHELAMGKASRNEPTDLNRPLNQAQLLDLYGKVMPGADLKRMTTPQDRQATFDRIVAEVEAGHAIPVGVYNGDDLRSQGHVITINGVFRDPQGNVTGLSYSSNGQQKFIPPERFEEFKQRLAFAFQPPAEDQFVQNYTKLGGGTTSPIPEETLRSMWADIADMVTSDSFKKQVAELMADPERLTRAVTVNPLPGMIFPDFQLPGLDFTNLDLPGITLPAASPQGGGGQAAGAFGDSDGVEGGFGAGDEAEGGFGDSDGVEGGFGAGDEAEGGFGDSDGVEGGFGAGDEAEGGFGDSDGVEGGFGSGDEAEGGFGDADGAEGGFGGGDEAEGGFGHYAGTGGF